MERNDWGAAGRQPRTQDLQAGPGSGARHDTWYEQVVAYHRKLRDDIKASIVPLEMHCKSAQIPVDMSAYADDLVQLAVGDNFDRRQPKGVVLQHSAQVFLELLPCTRDKRQEEVLNDERHRLPRVVHVLVGPRR